MRKSLGMGAFGRVYIDNRLLTRCLCTYTCNVEQYQCRPMGPQNPSFGAISNCFDDGVVNSSPLSFGLFPNRGRHTRYLYFYNMAFVLRSDALPVANPLFRGKTRPPIFHMKVGEPR